MKWRVEHPEPGIDFRGVDFRGQNLRQKFCVGLNLHSANLSGADCQGTQFQGAYCHGCDFTGANLSKANFVEAVLQEAKLDRCNLTGAIFVDTTLTDTSMVGADLSGARLERTRMVGTDLRDARLTGAHVYGLAAWDVKLEGAIQDNLVICKDIAPKAGDFASPMLIADSLELAQFLYLMMSSQKLRHALETITSKVVLILGRFQDPHKAVLEALRGRLRDRGYLPVIFDFERPTGRDLEETVVLLAHMARFVVADLTEPHSVPQELHAIVPNLLSVPVQPLLREGEEPYATFSSHLVRYPNVLPVKRYGEAIAASFVDEMLLAVEECRARVSGSSA